MANDTHLIIKNTHVILALCPDIVACNIQHQPCNCLHLVWRMSVGVSPSFTVMQAYCLLAKGVTECSCKDPFVQIHVTICSCTKVSHPTNYPECMHTVQAMAQIYSYESSVWTLKPCKKYFFLTLHCHKWMHTKNIIMQPRFWINHTSNRAEIIIAVRNSIQSTHSDIHAVMEYSCKPVST